MTILALIFAFISIMPTVEKWIFPNETKTLYQNIYELEKQISSESKRNLEMYKNLLDVQNQVKTLEKQNEQLKPKKPLKE
jgi:cell division protein FtsL